MEQLIPLIEDWGRDKGIDKLDPLMQTTKTNEEIIELQQAIIRYEKALEQFDNHHVPYAMFIDNECDVCQRHNTFCSDIHRNISGNPGCDYIINIKDAIGDIFITLVMLNMQTPRNLDDLLRYQNCEGNTLGYAFDLTTRILHYVSEFQRLYDTDIDIDDIPKVIAHLLEQIAKRYGLTLKECVEYTYNEIKEVK